jgi:cytoskeletal protein RodZ
MLIQISSDSHAQTAFDIFSKWSIVAVPVGGLLISFLGLLFKSRTEKDKPKPVPTDIINALHDAKMQVAIDHLEAKISDRIERQAKRSLRLQMVTALILLLLIAGINGYLWIVTRQLQTAIQPDQMHAAIAAAQDSKKPITNPLTPPQGIGASQKMKRQRPNPKPPKTSEKPQAATPD